MVVSREDGSNYFKEVNDSVGLQCSFYGRTAFPSAKMVVNVGMNVLASVSRGVS